MPDGYVFSRKTDPQAFLWPLLACLACAILECAVGASAHDLPILVYILAVVCCDVGHRGCSFLMAHQAVCLAKHRTLYIAVIPIVAALSIGTSVFFSETVLWVGIGYATLAHYGYQGWFLFKVARSVEGQKVTGFEKIALVLGWAAPVAAWHADPERSFDWFLRDDPLLFEVPREVIPVLFVLYVFAAALYLAKVWVKKEYQRTSTWVMVSSWVAWAWGVLYQSRSSSMLFMDVTHSVPMYFLSYHAMRSMWGAVPPPKTDAAAFNKHLTTSPAPFLLFLLLLALSEEFLIESFITHEWSANIFPHVVVSPRAKSIYAGLLTTPQVLHMVYDCLVWNEATNPGVSDALRGHLPHSVFKI